MHGFLEPQQSVLLALQSSKNLGVPRALVLFALFACTLLVIDSFGLIVQHC